MIPFPEFIVQTHLGINTWNLMSPSVLLMGFDHRVVYGWVQGIHAIMKGPLGFSTGRV